MRHGREPQGDGGREGNRPADSGQPRIAGTTHPELGGDGQVLQQDAVLLTAKFCISGLQNSERMNSYVFSSPVCGPPLGQPSETNHLPSSQPPTTNSLFRSGLNRTGHAVGKLSPGQDSREALCARRESSGKGMDCRSWKITSLKLNSHLGFPTASTLNTEESVRPQLRMPPYLGYVHGIFSRLGRLFP